ncbi:DUF4282 domain-containing protein [Halomonas sabkhae]|uniref:DUF4282 domain-containing protein n=1 Tax=Halomonas sabkhae TaxID=626223 RepID=UPI0025B32A7E|nr:DUF4282 domain-containing protein [Halomonas sabkhae]MDN3523666.1 DUF4282 domain-containing protein [Halomonas sabkhae]
MKLGDFTSFEKFLTPKLITFGYWVGIIVILLAGAGGVITALFSGEIIFLVINLIGILLGMIFWRVLCEGAILLFGIYDRLGEVRDGFQGSHLTSRDN